MEEKKRGNKQNLDIIRTEDEAKRKGRAGGIKSGQARREKADFKKKCQLWMETEVTKDKNGNPVTGADLMIAVAGKEIKNGSSKFWELMRDTAGFKPIDKVMVADVDQAVIEEVEAAVLGAETEEDDQGTGR
jgi:hypothetical protein